jgi:hypothetical protein
MKPKKIIDMHHHVLRRPAEEYADAAAKAAEENNIVKIVLVGLEYDGSDIGNNEDVLACWRRHKDLFVAFAGVDLWRPVRAGLIDELKEAGFAGLKFILPDKTYHDEAYYPYYERAQELRMPILFHLGLVARGGILEGLGTQPARVDCNLMRPVYLDTIARVFPELQMVGAHLGNPWYEEAGISCRWNPNLYFDLSGSTLKRKKPDFFADLLWWGAGTYTAYLDPSGRGAWDKIVFGSDVKAEDISDVVNDYLKVVEGLDLSKETTEAIFYRTAANILRWAGVECAGSS